ETMRTPDTFSYRSPNKRKRVTSLSNENTPSSNTGLPVDGAPPKKRAKTSTTKCQCSCTGCISDTAGRWASPRTDAQKIYTILATIKVQNWTFACFLYNIFQTKDIKGNEVQRSKTHAQMVSAFLASRRKRTVANIITEWMRDPSGRIPRNSSDHQFMFSTTVPYTEIGPVRA
ncbi:hypothetical protein C8R43DRAFT_852870, partial [Mycena crocata]